MIHDGRRATMDTAVLPDACNVVVCTPMYHACDESDSGIRSMVDDGRRGIMKLTVSCFFS